VKPQDAEKGADEIDDRLSRAPRDMPPPPPSPQMLKAIAAIKPVRTRSRFGAFLIVLALGAAWPAFTLIRFPLRKDLGALPAAWIAIGAALWSVTLVVSLAAALVPARGDVLPSAGRASRVSAIGMGLVLLFTTAWTAHAPGVSLRPEDIGMTLIQSCYGCGKYVLQVAAIFMILGLLFLRRVLPTGGRRIGLAVGAAGGALGGLALHFLCPIATTGHVLLSHVGTMVLASLAGALIFQGLLGR
jgi:negative regulator of sigma F NrsF-like protein